MEDKRKKKKYEGEPVKRSVGSRIADIISILFLLVAITITVLVFTSKATGNPSLFGRSLMSVQTDSMEPTLMVGDLIIDKVPTMEEANSLQVGDVISFQVINEEGTAYYTNTHRIIEVKQDSGGETYYTTQGDNAAAPDITQTYAKHILGVWESKSFGIENGRRIGGLGKVMDFLKSPMGFGLCVLLPIAVFFLYYLIDFIKKFSAYKAEVAAEEAAVAAETAAKAAKEAELSDEDKRRIAEEYLKQMQEQAKKEE